MRIFTFPNLLQLKCNMSQLARKVIVALQDINLTSVGRRIIYSILIGIVAGLGAVIFHLALQLASHLFLGVTAGYELTLSAVVARRWLLLLLPTVGGFISGIIVYRFAPETEGPSIDAVIEAFHYMAGFFAGVANTPISTIIMVSEMTGNYNLLAPSMWVCITSFLLLKRWSIYEKQVANRISSPVYHGEFVVDVLEELQVGDWLTKNAVSIPQQMNARQIAEYIRQTQHANFPVLNQNGELVGVLALRNIMAAAFGPDVESQTAGDLAEKEPITITSAQSLSEVLHIMIAHRRDFLPVLESPELQKLKGVFTRTDLITAYDSVTKKVRDMPRPHLNCPL